MIVDELKVKALARIVHEANKALCESLGDFSQKPWNEAPGYNHQSAMVGIRAICNHPDITHSELHEAWMAAKRADGWTYGETKDKAKKTHPSMIPYDQLSATEKYKDHLVKSIVVSYLNFLKDPS